MSRKIARITEDKKLLLGDEIVENNTKISLNNDGKLGVNEIIEYPDVLAGGRNLVIVKDILNGTYIKETDGIPGPASPPVHITTGFIKVEKNQIYTLQNIKEITQFRLVEFDVSRNYLRGANNGVKPAVFQFITSEDAEYIRFSYRYADSTSADLNTIKLEKGNQATPWTPAPEDLGLNYPDSIQNFNSSISGNNIITAEFIEGYPFVKREQL